MPAPPAPVEAKQTNCEPQASDLPLRQAELSANGRAPVPSHLRTCNVEACPHVPGWGVLCEPKAGQGPKGRPSFQNPPTPHLFFI